MCVEWVQIEQTCGVKKGFCDAPVKHFKIIKRLVQGENLLISSGMLSQDQQVPLYFTKKMFFRVEIIIN